MDFMSTMPPIRREYAKPRIRLGLRRPPVSEHELHIATFNLNDKDAATYWCIDLASEGITTDGVKDMTLEYHTAIAVIRRCWRLQTLGLIHRRNQLWFTSWSDECRQ